MYISSRLASVCGNLGHVLPNVLGRTNMRRWTLEFGPPVEGDERLTPCSAGIAPVEQ